MKPALALLVAGLTLLGVERFSDHALSTALGKAYCGSSFNAPVNGIVGDMSCGFNADMYTAAVAILMVVVGAIATLWFSLRRTNRAPA